MVNTTEKKNHKKLIVTVLFIFLIIPAIALYFGIVKHQTQTNVASNVKINGLVLNPPKELSGFKLTDHAGNAFTQNQLKGHWTVMFFGFSNCGMVCPATLSALNKMYLSLEKEIPADKLPQVVMVTVDPERDTIVRMNSYVKSFNPNFVGVTGDMSETVALEKQLNIVAVKVQADEKDKSNYYYNHSTEILVINPEAKVQAYLSSPHKPEDMVKDYKAILTTMAS